MLIRIIFLLLCGAIVSTPLSAKEKKEKNNKKRAETAQTEQSAYDKLFQKKHEVADGMIRLHKIGQKLYFEFPFKLLDREMLLGSVISQTSDNLTGVPGSKSDIPLHIVFTQTENHIQIRRISSQNYLLGISRNIRHALDRNNTPTIFRNFKIEAYNPDSTAVVFDVTELFVSHIKELSPFSYFGAYGESLSESFKKERSSLDQIKAFSDNLTVKSTLSYTYTVTHPQTKQKLVDNAPFTASMTRTLVLLDKTPYRPRITDSRMSVFPTGKYLYNETGRGVRAIYLANRWRLEPSDIEAWKAGQCVRPLKPITFYIDPDFPEKWKPAVYEGVTQWNELFEKIGFKEAIQALPYPEFDPEFDPDNIKYSCLRYAPTPIANAMGPSWIDPRSGEIINASVYVFHDVVKMLTEMLFVQTAQADKRVRRVEIPDEILRDGLRYVLSHEVGHCLGFMHNMSSSSVIPVDSLRSPSFTQKYGTTTSIMDYARFNYVAQPGDMERGVRLTPPRFGLYDEYAIKWLYTPIPEAHTPEEEYEITSQWITRASADSTYRYGKQQFGSTVDPKSQMEDLGDDAMAASEYGIKNLRYILEHLDQWYSGQDNDYSARSNMYTAIVNQYITYISHVYANIGGIYLNEKREGDPVEAIRCVPRERQREALRFIFRQLSQLEWLDNTALLKKTSLLGSPQEAVREALIRAVVNAPTKQTLAVNAQLSEDKDRYTPEACYRDITDFIWEPTRHNRQLSQEEMAIQREFIKVAATRAGLKHYTGGGSSSFVCTSTAHAPQSRLTIEKPIDNPIESAIRTSVDALSGFGAPQFRYFISKDLTMRYHNDLHHIRDLISSKIRSASGETRMHYQYLLYNLDKALNQ